MHERENILRIFQDTKKAVEEGDSAEVKNLSNQTNNTASLTQDPDNIAAAVVVYALSKVLERDDYKKLPGWNKFYEVYIRAIDRIIDSLKKGDDEAYRRDIKVIRGAISKLSGKLRDYIQDVLRKASINRASKLYEHGLSMEKTASLLGVTLYELASYIGQKEVIDIPELRSMDIRKRVKMAEDFFG